MTTFSGPLIVKVPNAQTTVMSVDVSGSATLEQGLTASHLTATGSIASTNRIRTGATGRVGTVLVSQRATINSTNSGGSPVKFLLPSGADIVDILVDIEVPFAAGALVTAGRVLAYKELGNTPTSAENILTEVLVSSSGRYDAIDDGTIGSSGAAALRNVSVTIAAYVSMQALASAFSAGQGILTINYFQNS